MSGVSLAEIVLWHVCWKENDNVFDAHADRICDYSRKETPPRNNMMRLELLILANIFEKAQNKSLLKVLE